MALLIISFTFGALKAILEMRILKYQFFIHVLLLFCFGVKSQTQKDSLWQVWKNDKQPDTARIRALQVFCVENYLYSKPDTAFILAKKIYDFSVKKELKRDQAASLQILAISCSVRGDNMSAVDYFTKSLKIAEELGDYKSIANSINNIGVIYADLRNNPKAIEYYKKSLALNEKFNKKKGIISALGNLGAIYKEMGLYKQAIETQSHSLKLAEEINDERRKANALHALAGIYSDLKEFKNALDYETKALKIYEIFDDKNAMAQVMTIMGLCYQATNQTQKAEEILKKALEISQKGGFVASTREASRYLYYGYKKEHKVDNALAMYELYIQMRDSIQNEKSSNHIVQQEMQYNYEKQKALDKKEQEKRIAISLEQEKRQKIISLFIAIGLFMALLFALFVVNRLKITKKQKTIIEKQKHIVEEKQKEILESIHYAKRIQQTLLPTQKYLEKYLNH